MVTARTERRAPCRWGSWTPKVAYSQPLSGCRNWRPTHTLRPMTGHQELFPGDTLITNIQPLSVLRNSSSSMGSSWSPRGYWPPEVWTCHCRQMAFRVALMPTPVEAMLEAIFRRKCLGSAEQPTAPKYPRGKAFSALPNYGGRVGVWAKFPRKCQVSVSGDSSDDTPH